MNTYLTVVDIKRYELCVVIQGSSAVQSLQHVAQSYSMRVTWQPPANRNGIITGYKVSYQLRQRGTCSEVNGEWSDAKLATSLYHDLTGLHPYSLYRVRVVPVNGAGDGAEATVDWRTASIGKLSEKWFLRTCFIIIVYMYLHKSTNYIWTFNSNLKNVVALYLEYIDISNEVRHDVIYHDS